MTKDPYQVLLVQPNFKIGGGSFTGYWLSHSLVVCGVMLVILKK